MTAEHNLARTYEIFIITLPEGTCPLLGTLCSTSRQPGYEGLNCSKDHRRCREYQSIMNGGEK